MTRRLKEYPAIIMEGKGDDAYRDDLTQSITVLRAAKIKRSGKCPALWQTLTDPTSRIARFNISFA
jgi:hypothetical protein